MIRSLLLDQQHTGRYNRIHLKIQFRVAESRSFVGEGTTLHSSQPVNRKPGVDLGDTIIFSVKTKTKWPNISDYNELSPDFMLNYVVKNVGTSITAVLLFYLQLQGSVGVGAVICVGGHYISNYRLEMGKRVDTANALMYE
jgi:hypothetical protein